MVATRRGTRVGSPVKNTSDENSGATQPTPSTRSTRRRTLMEENQSQSDSQPDEAKDDTTASSLASPPKRDTRRSTRALANKKQPDSTHDEADVSESESCCSVASDAPVTPRTRRRTAVRGKRAVQDEVSEAESCSSAVSATRSRTAPRSLRKRVLTSVALKDEDAKDDEEASEVDSCSSAVSLTKGMDTRRVTRSHRKASVPTTDADQSEPESCSSSVSGLRSSTVRRSTRNPRVKVTEPIPLSLEETPDAPSSPVSKSLRSRSRKTRVEDVEYDSEGCKSGPSMSPWRSTRRQRKVVGESDSESVATDVCASHGSPSPQRGKGTPCSSRTGSASSNRAVPVTRTRSRSKVSSDVSDTDAAKPEEQKESDKHSSIPELDKDEEVDQLDSTMTMDTSEVQECTIIEEKAEDTTVVLDQDESVEMLEAQSCTQDVHVVEDQETLQGETVAENSGKPSEDIEPKDIPEERKPEVVEDSVSDDAEKVVVDQQDVQVVEDHETEKLQEEPVAENSGAVSEDKELKDSAMERELEIVETSHDVEEQMIETVPEDSLPDDVEKVVEDLVESTPEDPAPAVVEEKVESEKKGVIVTEEAVEMTEDDLEAPSTSSHTVAETSQAAPLQKETISLLDSSEDEDSADEGLSSEGEGRSQEAEDDQSEDDVTCPDEDQMAEAHGNGLFVIDTKPGLRAEEQYFVDAKQTEEEDEEDFVDEEGDEDDDEDSKALFAPKKPLMQLSSSIDTGLKMKELGGLYISFDGNKPKTLSSCSKTQKDQGNQDEVLKKSVIVPDFEKKDAVPPYKESRNATKLKRKAEREKTTGDGWFNMRAPELTEELKNDLKALKMRSAMDPKRFYKKNDREGFPKYFQVGTVVDSPVDFYTSRIPKKQRKKTIVEELLADAEFRSYNKRKYQEIMTEKAAQAAGKHNKKQKFHKKKTNKS